VAGRPAFPIEPYIDKLCQALRVGATYELAAKYAGISYLTFLRWRQRAETAKDGTPLALLRDRMEQVEGEAAIGWLAKIELAATEGNWQAAAWKLERRYPEQYSREAVKKVALTTPDGSESYGGEGLAALLALAQHGVYATNGSAPQE
jgi:transposase